jgi:hypothetical protein
MAPGLPCSFYFLLTACPTTWQERVLFLCEALTDKFMVLSLGWQGCEGEEARLAMQILFGKQERGRIYPQSCSTKRSQQFSGFVEKRTFPAPNLDFWDIEAKGDL